MTKTAQYQANIYKVCLHSFFSGTRPFLPILFVYLNSLGLSYLQIGTLFSIMAISSLFWEIPAGTFSDRYGAKYSIMFSSLIFSFVFSAIGIFKSYSAFVVIFIFWGAAKAFYSGSDVTILIESLKYDKNELKTSKYIGHKWSAFYIGLCAGGLLSPLIIPYGKQWTFFTTGFLYLISMALIATVKQPPLEKDNQESIHYVKTIGDYFSFLNRGKNYLLTHDFVKYLLILNVVLVTCSMIYFQYLQHILKEAGIPTVHFGYYYAVFTFCAALVSRKSHSVDNWIGMKNSILLIILLTMFSLFGGLYKGVALVSLIPILFMQLQTGLCIPLMTTYLNKYIDSHHRTTLNSMKSFSGGITLAVLSSLVGAVADVQGFRQALAGLAVIMIISCLGPVLKVIQRS